MLNTLTTIFPFPKWKEPTFNFSVKLTHLDEISRFIVTRFVDTRHVPLNTGMFTDLLKVLIYVRLSEEHDYYAIKAINMVKNYGIPSPLMTVINLLPRNVILDSQNHVILNFNLTDEERQEIVYIIETKLSTILNNLYSTFINVKRLDLLVKPDLWQNNEVLIHNIFNSSCTELHLKNKDCKLTKSLALAFLFEINTDDHVGFSSYNSLRYVVPSKSIFSFEQVRNEILQLLYSGFFSSGTSKSSKSVTVQTKKIENTSTPSKTDSSKELETLKYLVISNKELVKSNSDLVSMTLSIFSLIKEKLYSLENIRHQDKQSDLNFNL